MNLTRREGRFIGTEIKRQRRDFLRASDAAHRLTRDERGLHLIDARALRLRLLRDALLERRRPTVPGQIALQRMPRVTKSAATDFVRPMTAAFDAPYTKRFGTPFTLDAADDMLMIEPPPFSSIAGRNARIVRYMAFAFRSKAKSQSASVASRIEPA